MTDNLAIWRKVEKTDPRYVKAITGKQYKGNSPSPHWIKMRLTEVFGPAGIGWGTKVLDEKIVVVGDRHMHYLRLQLWFVLDGKRGEIEDFGGTELGGKRQSGQGFADEDAPKKSMTDALVKAASALGFAADIFLGRWDDSKYVAAREAEVDAEQRTQAEAAKVDLRRTVQSILDDLANAEGEGDVKRLSGEALLLKPKLEAAGLADAIDLLRKAIAATKQRLASEAQRAAA